MPFRLQGLPEEDRIAIEEASGGTIDTEAARIIIERSVQQAQALSQAALREVQEVIGPHGAVTRLQAGGVRITPGSGIGVFTDGVAKTNIQNNGTLVIGSDITNPTTTTEIFFTEDTVYNSEQFLAGDFLIGDNTTGSSNIKYSALDGQLQFRGGQTVQAYMDTDGSIKAGGGDVTIDQFGVSFANQEGEVNFQDTSGNDGNLIIYSDGLDHLVLHNKVNGKAIRFDIDTTDDTTVGMYWQEDPANANVTLLNLEAGPAGLKIIADGVEYAPKSAFHMHDEFICSTPETKGGFAAGQRYNTWSFPATPANGVTWDIGLFLQAGTYTCTVLGETDNASGKLDWTLDGVSQTTAQDWYTAGAVVNEEKSFTLTATKSGYQKLTATVNGKNGSSSNYYWTHTAIYIRPAAY